MSWADGELSSARAGLWRSFDSKRTGTTRKCITAGDEIVYVLTGAIDLVLQEPGGNRTIPLESGTGHLVPRGVWHTARVRAPANVLHVTPGAGTQHRPL
jgi:uncharacterized cupin superfamily protein